ncbi:membrane hypothetical protein [Nitrosopumilaceae archaeon]|nr:membrane hypothetical protein [Nitrosopumilaceae archaeon]
MEREVQVLRAFGARSKRAGSRAASVADDTGRGLGAVRAAICGAASGIITSVALLSGCAELCGGEDYGTGNPVFLAGVFSNLVPVLLYRSRRGPSEYFRGLVPVLFPAIGSSLALATLFLGLGGAVPPSHGLLALIPAVTAAFQAAVLCRCDGCRLGSRRGASIAANLAAAAILSAAAIMKALGLDAKSHALPVEIVLQLVGMVQ